MAKIYSKKNPKNVNQTPKPETISFLLNYSKALRVIDYNKMKFEALLN
ncbi:MAG: hypothetical protein ACPGUH_04660 [Winogradskyella sp.]